MVFSVPRTLVILLAIVGFATVWVIAEPKASSIFSSFITHSSTSRVARFCVFQTNSRLCPSPRLSTVVVSDSSVFCAMRVFNLPTSCIVVDSTIFLTLDRLIGPSVVDSGVKRSATRLPQLVSISLDSRSCRFAIVAFCSNMFSSRSAGQFCLRWEGGILSACQIGCSGLSSKATTWRFDLLVLWVKISQLPFCFFGAWCVFDSRV